MTDKYFITKKPNWRQEFKRLEGAYAPSTMKSYYVNVEKFVSWCEANKFQAFPADVLAVSAFLEEQAKNYAISTIRQRLYAIKKIHRLLNLADPTNSEEINIVYRRIRRTKFSRPRQAKALNRNHRNRFMQALPQDPWGLRDKVMIALGYDILARRSEIVALMTSDIKFRKDGTARVIIRRSKVDQFGSGRFAFTSRETARLLTKRIDWRGEDVESLFCPIYQGKVVDRSLNVTTVKRAIKRAAKLAGFNEKEVGEFSAHSMRVGAAQDLLCAGHDTAAIMRAGGWKSIDVLARYLENAEHNVWANI